MNQVDQRKCDQFIKEFSDVYTNTGMYERCLMWAFEEIEQIDNAQNVTLGNGHNAENFIVFHTNHIGVYKRSLRGKCKTLDDFSNLSHLFDFGEKRLIVFFS